MARSDAGRREASPFEPIAVRGILLRVYYSDSRGNRFAILTVRYKYVSLHECQTTMNTIPLPKEIEGPSPLLRTLHEVEILLRTAVAEDEGPISLAEIERRMHAKSVRHATIRACVDELKRLHLVTEDPRRGVIWTFHEDPKFWSREGLMKL